MFIKALKRAFTIVELVVVIAVIAALAAVLIPTFANVINAANDSSDEQAVKNMNTALSADEALNDKPVSLCGVWQILEEAGYNPTLTPSYSDNEFYWYENVNRIVIYSKTSQTITYPVEYEGLTLSGTKITSATETGKSTVSNVKTATSSEISEVDVSFLALDTDEDLATAHDFEGASCAVCHKDRTVSAGSNSNLSEVISKSGWISLSEDITISSTVSSLLTDSSLEDICVDLGDNSLTLVKDLQVQNRVNTYVTEENFYEIFGEEYSEEYSYLIGYVLNYALVPMDVTISGGEIECSSKGYLRIDSCNNVVIENVDFTSDSTTAVRAIQAYCSKDTGSTNNYTFKNCTFTNTYVQFQSATVSEFNVVFENCTFTGSFGNGNGCVIFETYVYGSVEFNGCTFSEKASGKATAAIVTNSYSSALGDNVLEITLINCDITCTSNIGAYTWNSYYASIMFLRDANCVVIKEEGTNTYILDGEEVSVDGTAIS